MKKFAAATAVPKCSNCNRAVYANDPQVVLDGLSYHRACAKCTECKCQITIQNFAKSGTTLYCRTHYFKKFNEEGTLLGSEKFTHQSAPGKFAGSGFAIPSNTSDSAAPVAESASAAALPLPIPTHEPEPVRLPTPPPVENPEPVSVPESITESAANSEPTDPQRVSLSETVESMPEAQSQAKAVTDALPESQSEPATGEEETVAEEEESV